MLSINPGYRPPDPVTVSRNALSYTLRAEYWMMALVEMMFRSVPLLSTRKQSKMRHLLLFQGFVRPRTVSVMHTIGVSSSGGSSWANVDLSHGAVHEGFY